jgi:hypothetical protein
VQMLSGWTSPTSCRQIKVSTVLLRWESAVESWQSSNLVRRNFPECEGQQTA